jgi:hypothetical protein
MADDATPEKPLTTTEWFFTLFILALPLIGLVMYFVWSFGETGNISRRNFCRATLLWFLICFGFGVLCLIGFLIFGGTMAALSNHFGK